MHLASGPPILLDLTSLALSTRKKHTRADEQDGGVGGGRGGGGDGGVGSGEGGGGDRGGFGAKDLRAPKTHTAAVETSGLVV